MQVLFYPDGGHSPAWPLVNHAVVELESKGLAFPQFIAPAWNDPCMVAVDDYGNAVGFLIYRYDEARAVWFIMLAWVHEQHRRAGVHTAMFNALVDRAKARGDILAIECGTHVDNVAAQAAFEAQGRAKTAIMYTYRLRDWAEGKSPTDAIQ